MGYWGIHESHVFNRDPRRLHESLGWEPAKKNQPSLGRNCNSYDSHSYDWNMITWFVTEFQYMKHPQNVRPIFKLDDWFWRRSWRSLFWGEFGPRYTQSSVVVVVNKLWLVGGFSPPLWKIWIRQLGWLFSIYGKIKVMFQSPPTSHNPFKSPLNHH